MDQPVTWWRSGSVVVLSVEDALKQLADRLAGAENALMQERSAKLNAEADPQSLRAQVTPTGVTPTVDHTALADSVTRAVVAAHEQNLWTPVLLHNGQVPVGANSLARRGCGTAELHIERHTEMTAVEGKTVVTPNVAVIIPDSVARSKSLHFVLTMLVEGPALDTILNSGQGEGYESWRRLVLEYDPRSRVRAAGSMMEILSHPFIADSSSFEAFDARVSMHEPTTSKAIQQFRSKIKRTGTATSMR